jgi:hypothetical protein
MRSTRSRHRAGTALAALLAAALTALLVPLSGSAGPAEAPVNGTAPSIGGIADRGQTLTAGPGSWAGSMPMTFTYQWRRCDDDGANCADVAGATGQTHALGSADVGKRIRVRVTATNGDGTSNALSGATAKVTEGTPVNRVDPVVSGTPTEGLQLSTSNGTWLGLQPMTFVFQWVRCGADGGGPDGSACAVIAGATKSTYTPVASDIGSRLRARVVATNSVGKRTDASAPTQAVSASGPAGVVVLPGGRRSIPATSVSAAERLVVADVRFSPNPVRSRTAPLTISVRVMDTRGFVVRDALVFARSTPLVTRGDNRVRTRADGWVSLTVAPRFNFPRPRPGFNVQFFVKAYRAGDPGLAGVAGYRLVQVKLGRLLNVRLSDTMSG